MPAELVRLETAGHDDRFRFFVYLWKKKSVFPVTVLWFYQDPAVFRHRLQVEDIEAELLSHSKNALFLDNVVRGIAWPAAFGKGDFTRAHLFKVGNQRVQ